MKRERVFFFFLFSRRHHLWLLNGSQWEAQNEPMIKMQNDILWTRCTCVLFRLTTATAAAAVAFNVSNHPYIYAYIRLLVRFGSGASRIDVWFHSQVKRKVLKNNNNKNNINHLTVWYIQIHTLCIGVFSFFIASSIATISLSSHFIFGYAQNTHILNFINKLIDDACKLLAHAKETENNKYNNILPYVAVVVCLCLCLCLCLLVYVISFIFFHHVFDYCIWKWKTRDAHQFQIDQRIGLYVRFRAYSFGGHINWRNEGKKVQKSRHKIFEYTFCLFSFLFNSQEWVFK